MSSAQYCSRRPLRVRRARESRHVHRRAYVYVPGLHVRSEESVRSIDLGAEVRDVTNEMLEYAAARLNLWNAFFRRKAESSRQNEFIEDFQEIDRLLLLSVVGREMLELRVPEDFFLGESCIEGLEVALADLAPGRRAFH